MLIRRKIERLPSAQTRRRPNSPRDRVHWPYYPTSLVTSTCGMDDERRMVPIFKEIDEESEYDV